MASNDKKKKPAGCAHNFKQVSVKFDSEMSGGKTFFESTREYKCTDCLKTVKSFQWAYELRPPKWWMSDGG